MMGRRNLLTTALAVAGAATVAFLFGAGAGADTRPATTGGHLHRQGHRQIRPRIERYGWVDAYGNETIGYRKVWPDVDYSNGEGARARHR